jgi:hypothetical protein
MMDTSTVSSDVASHPASKPVQPDDRWILTQLNTYPRGL